MAIYVLILGFAQAEPHEIKTNAVFMADAPRWVTMGRVDRVVDRIQSLLEWSIRRINVYWYADQAEFEKVHGKGPTVQAFARKSDNTVHVGPKVNEANFPTENPGKKTSSRLK